jgi:DNA repair photolyase
MKKKSNQACKPVFGTTEWATKNENLISGCSHDCKYCYAKAVAVRVKRKTTESWSQEEIKKPALLNKKFRKREGKIMIPSSHDITPRFLSENIQYIGNILAAGNEILLVSKPHLECIQEMCRAFTAFKSQIIFRFTIGSMDSDVLKFWEPNAPDFHERLESLKHAYEQGYQTSVSCEPMLDDKVEDVVTEVLPFVTDSVWIGKPNKLVERLSHNGYKDSATVARARELMASLSDEYIFHLYDRYQGNDKIRWKESVKKILDIEVPTQVGLDI